jgi:hypothetical protein
VLPASWNTERVTETLEGRLHEHEPQQPEQLMHQDLCGGGNEEVKIGQGEVKNLKQRKALA